MPYIHFTEEQKRQANAVNLVEFLRFKGEPLIRSGPEFRMTSNHSLTVQDNEWYDHAAEKGGGPVSFLKEFYGMNYQEAVLTLLNEDVSQLCSPVTKPKPDGPRFCVIKNEIAQRSVSNVQSRTHR